MPDAFRLLLPIGTPVLDVLDLFPRRAEAQLRWGGLGWAVEFSCDPARAAEIAVEVARLVEAVAQGQSRGEAEVVRLERAA